MRLTALGKFLVLILVAGGAIGAWRWYQGQGGAATPGKPGGNWLAGLGPATAPRGGVEIPFVITAAKKDWVQEQVDRFNREHGGKWKVVPLPTPSREAMHAILEGKVKPVLWSPGSPIWPNRLAEAWGEKHSGQVLDPTDPNGYRVFLRSPLVFLTTRENAKFLRPHLGSPKPWAALRRLSTGKTRAPWGRVRFSHADPLTSSSGMLTLGLIMNEYAQETGKSGSFEKLATDHDFLRYLKELETGLIYDDAAEKGTTALTKAFVRRPTSYDFITAYESAALEAVAENPKLAVIYPNPTSVSEHAVSLLTAEWVTPQQREGALQFLNFLGGKQALMDGMKYHFRPAQTAGSLSLSGELARYQQQGFQPTFSAIELPPYEALNAVAYQFRVQVVNQPPAPGEKG